MNRSCGGIIINNGMVALISEAGYYYGFPKGKCEYGESDLETAKREIEEETGLKDIRLEHELSSYQRSTIFPGIKKEIKLFIFKTDSTNLIPQDSFNPDAKWVPIKDVEKHLHHKKDKEFYKKNIDIISSFV